MCSSAPSTRAFCGLGMSVNGMRNSVAACCVEVSRPARCWTCRRSVRCCLGPPWCLRSPRCQGRHGLLMAQFNGHLVVAKVPCRGVRQQEVVRLDQFPADWSLKWPERASTRWCRR